MCEKYQHFETFHRVFEDWFKKIKHFQDFLKKFLAIISKSVGPANNFFDFTCYLFRKRWGGRGGGGGLKVYSKSRFV